MDIVSSYGVKLYTNKQTRLVLQDTINVYRSALSYIAVVVNENWETIGPVFAENKKKAQQAVELLIHQTKQNPNPKYDFDKKFVKYPSYFRRATIDAALGLVSSYVSNYQNWLDGGQKGNPPTFQPNTNQFPALFNGNMSLCKEMLKGTSRAVSIKVFMNNDWVWLQLDCRKSDVAYILNHMSHAEACSPVLKMERCPHKKNVFELQFAFKEKVDLSLADVPLENRKVLSVDLGINTDAVCTVMDMYGTVCAREFINFPQEKDQMYRVLNKMKRHQREHGYTGTSSYWANAMNISDDLAIKISRAIVDVAVKHGVHVIVFEHLDFKKRVYGRNKQKLHLWRKRKIQDMVEHNAHRNMIRISRICAWGTSRLAFDGSGRVERYISNDGQKENYSLCRFKNGKQYNCDLNASYNIGARYFLRELCDVYPELKTALPSAVNRTYSDLWNLFKRHAGVEWKIRIPA